MYKHAAVNVETKKYEYVRRIFYTIDNDLVDRRYFRMEFLKERKKKLVRECLASS